MEQCPPLHLSVVAIEKGAFKTPLTKVANFTYYATDDRATEGNYCPSEK